MALSVEDRFETLHEVIKAAHANLDRNAWDYLIGGGESETTVARNRQALDSVAFRPRVLRDMSKIDCSASFLGRRLRIPVMLCPVGSLETFDPEAGAAVAEAAGTFGVGMLLSSVSEPGLEKTAARAPEAFRVFQLYVRGDQVWVDDQIRRAIDAGYQALCVTVDTAWVSRRERDITKRYKPYRRRAPGREFQASLSWRDIERCRAKFDLPMMLKGIATAEDAEAAVKAGIDVVYVSNHGGRQLDHGLGTLEVLPQIVEAVGGRARVMVDGGFSRGSDVIKAIVLGADAVGIGRLYVYGLAAAGSAGVVRVLEILEDEIMVCLGLLGAAKWAELDRSYLCAARPVSTPGVHSAFPLLDLPPQRY